MKKPFALWSAAMLCGVSIVTSAWAGLEELTPDQMDKLDRYEQVAIYKDVAGSAWPRAILYQRIAVEPIQAAAVFHDYEAQKTYLDITKSQIAKRINKSTVEVDYELKQFGIPFGYTVKDHVEFNKESSSYITNWTLVKGNFLKEVTGNAVFAPYAKGGTLTVYTALISPTFPMSGLFKNQAKATASETLGKFVKHILDVVKNRSDVLDMELRMLQMALEPEKAQEADAFFEF